MKRLIVLFSLLLLVLGYLVTESKQMSQRQEGIFSSPIDAQIGLSNLPAQHFLCGVSTLQKRYGVNLRNCNCRRRWFRWRCDWCINNFYDMTAGLGLIFCHYSNWHDQRFKNFYTNSPDAGLWRQTIMCKPNHYANGYSIRQGHNHVPLGLTGFKIHCSSLDFSSNYHLQGSLKYPIKQPFFNPRQGNFVSSVQVRYLDRQQITGIRFNYEPIGLISRIQFKYQPFVVPQANPVQISKQQIRNSGSTVLQKKVLFSKNFSTNSQWKTDNAFIQNYLISNKIISEPPVFEQRKNDGIDGSYSLKSFNNPFKFSQQLTCQYNVYQQLIIVVRSRARSVATTDALLQRGVIPFNAQITYSNIYSGDLIKKFSVPGKWIGTTLAKIDTNVRQFELQRELRKQRQQEIQGND